ncbi:MAG TPA: fatty acyl-AMP ligase [Candidatus Limnocylindrales bacterium]|nr:fatty acyl-AMP ligase [Candidatus Limnocylindrales bacterium]
MTGLPFNSTAEISTLVDLLRLRALQQPQQKAYTFLVDGEGEELQISYEELDRKARMIGGWLQNAGVTGERALLLYPPGLEYITAFFGCLYAGVIAVPAYPPRFNRSMSRLQAIAEDAQATVALTTKSILSRIGCWLDPTPLLKNLHWIITDTLDALTPLQLYLGQTLDSIQQDEPLPDLQETLAEAWQNPAIDGNALAFLQYTSGSTGVPRGVRLTHGNLLYNLTLIHQCFGHTPKSRGVIWLPPYHDMGLAGGILQPLYGGFPVTLMSPFAFLQRPFRWLQAISRTRATTSGGPNFAYDFCVQKITPEQRATLDLSCWEVAFNGAEPVRAETLDRFVEAFEPCGFRREAFYPCYGLAEATLIVSGGLKGTLPTVLSVLRTALKQNQVVEASPLDSSTKDTQKLIGCGRSLPGQKIIIVDPESLTLCSPDRVGEIWVSGPSVAQGYWNRSEETKQTFKAYLADTGEGPFLRTGDLGFLKKGELFVTGRLKNLIILGGRNYYPQDIEQTVEQSHPALRPGCCAAFSIDQNGEERLVIVAELEHSYDLRRWSIKEIVGSIRQAVVENHEMHIHAVLLLKANSIPKTSSGKIQHYACRAGFLSGSLNVLEE